MHHFSHYHPLILNQIYHAKEGDMCYGCNEQIVSCKLFVYSCSHTSQTASTSDVDDECLTFLLHKNCAELPRIIQIPEYQKRDLFLRSWPKFLYKDPTCNICNMQWKWFIYDDLDRYEEFYVCVKCAMFQLQSLEDRKFNHPAHDHHPLTLIQHLASFKCYACQVEDNVKDLSYICLTCPFWMHKNCADAPTSSRFQFHNQHPLLLSFSLPQVYRKFDQYCKLCNKKLNPLTWLYYCWII